MAQTHAITIGPELLPAGYEAVEPGSDLLRLEALARALMASPGWPSSLRAVVSDDPGPLLVLYGKLREREGQALEDLRHELAGARVRYVDHSAVELVAQGLARRLTDSLDDLDRWKFAAVPRGGLIVLGILSYLLDLDHSQVVASDASVDSLVLIDDCAFSGSRLKASISSSNARRLAVGTLFAPKELRAAVEREEPRVVLFESGEDLADVAPQQLGDDYEEWRRRWGGRSDGYWNGRTEHLALPWNEPDVGRWDQAAERVELAWRLVPPERCLKNRVGSADPSPVQRFERAGGGHRQASGVLDVRVDDEVVVIDTHHGRTLTLDGVAADMWTAAMTTADLADAVSNLATVYGGDADRLEGDLAAFLARLSAEGLIEVAAYGLSGRDETP